MGFLRIISSTNIYNVIDIHSSQYQYVMIILLQWHYAIIIIHAVFAIVLVCYLAMLLGVSL